MPRRRTATGEDPGLAFLDALLDAVDAKSDFARLYSDLGAEELDDDVDALAAAAACRNATCESVAKAARRVSRKALLLLAAAAVEADELTRRTVAAQAAIAAGGKRSRRIGPVRREHLEERRARRGDAFSASTYPALSYARALPDPGYPPVGSSGRILGHPGQPGGYSPAARGDAQLPALEDLADMSDADLLRLLRRQGVTVNVDALLADKLADSMTRLVGARFPDEALIESVAAAARRRVRQTFLVQAKEILRLAERAKHKASGSTRMLWVSVLDQGTCFAAGTMVETPDGPRRIETISASQYVIGSSGRARRVLRAFCLPSQEWYEVRFASGHSVTCTPGHRFLGADGCWREARELEAGVRVRRLRRADVGEVLLQLGLPEQGSRDGQDARDVRDMRVRVPADRSSSAPVLLCQVPSLAEGDEVMSEVRASVRCSAESERPLRDLLTRVQGQPQPASLSAMRRGVPRAGQAPPLLGGVSQTDSHSRVSDVLADLPRDPGHARFPSSLFSPVLPALDRPDPAGGVRMRGARPHGARVPPRGANSAMDGGLLRSVEAGGNRSGRGLLALDRAASGVGPQARRGDEERTVSGIEDPRERRGKRDGGSAGRAGAYHSDEDVVAAVRRFRRDAPAFDVSVDEDHAYLVAGGVVVHNCESCSDRHNESQTLAEWEREGLPGSDNLICGANCRCELLPDDWFEAAGGEGEEEGGVTVTLTEAEEPGAEEE